MKANHAFTGTGYEDSNFENARQDKKRSFLWVLRALLAFSSLAKSQAFHGKRLRFLKYTLRSVASQVKNEELCDWRAHFIARS